MKALLQRSGYASVRVADKTVSSIRKGLCIFIGVEKTDTVALADRLARKVLDFRIFQDAAGKMNQSVRDISGEILVVSQFTLAADVRKGNRPSFEPAAPPAQARELIARFVSVLGESGLAVRQGEFGAHMQVELQNEGPVTFLLSEP